MVPLTGWLICFTELEVLNQLFSNTFFNSFGYETKIRNRPLVLEVVRIQRGPFEQCLISIACLRIPGIRPVSKERLTILCIIGRIEGNRHLNTERAYKWKLSGSARILCFDWLIHPGVSYSHEIWIFSEREYLLLTEFEGRTVTYSTDRENEVSKIFIISLECVWEAQERFLFTRNAPRKQNESIWNRFYVVNTL